MKKAAKLVQLAAALCLSLTFSVSADAPSDRELVNKYLQWSVESLESELASAEPDSRTVIKQQLLISIYGLGGKPEAAEARQTDLARELPEFASTTASEAAIHERLKVDATLGQRELMAQVFENLSANANAIDPTLLALAMRVIDPRARPYDGAKIFAIASVEAALQSDIEHAAGAFLLARHLMKAIEDAGIEGGTLEDIALQVRVIADAKGYVTQAGDLLAELIMQYMTKTAQEQSKQGQTAGLLQTSVFAAEIFTLTGDWERQWTAYYMAALAQRDLGDHRSMLNSLLNTMQSFSGLKDDELEKIDFDGELASGLILTSMQLALEKIQEMVPTDADQTQESTDSDVLSVADAFAYTEVIVDAARRLGEVLGRPGTEFQSQLMLVQLASRMEERDPAVIVEEFNELLAIHPFVMEALEDANAESAVNEQFRILTNLITSLVFEAGDRVELARQCYESAKQAMALTGADAATHVSQELLWGEFLQQRGLLPEAISHYRELLEDVAPTHKLGVLLGESQWQGVNARAFIGNNIGDLLLAAGETQAAVSVQREALETATAQGSEEAGLIRALLSVAEAHYLSGDLARALEAGRRGRELAEQRLLVEEQASARIPLAMSQLGDSGPGLDTLVTGSLPAMFRSSSTLMAMRFADDDAGLQAAMMAPWNPRPRAWRRMVDEIPREAIANARDAVAVLLEIGQSFELLGDPLAAQDVYRATEALSRDLGIDGALSAALYHHAGLYLREHRYFSWFDRAPAASLRWSPSETDTKNPVFARRKLDEAFRLSQSERDVLLSARIAALALDSFDETTASTEMQLEWTERAMRVFNDLKAQLANAGDFASDRVARLAVSDLYAQLDDAASNLDEKADGLKTQHDLIGATAAWEEAVRIYQRIDNQGAAGSVLAKQATVWGILQRPELEAEDLDAAVAAMGGGYITYGQRSDFARIVPRLVIRTVSDTAIASLSFEELRYDIDPTPIQQAAAKPDTATYLMLARSLFARGRYEDGRRVGDELLNNLDENSPEYLLSRLTLTSLEQQTDLSIAIQKYREQIAELKALLTELESKESGEFTIDLSSNTVSGELDKSFAADVGANVFAPMAGLFDRKGLLLVLIETLNQLGSTLNAHGNPDAAIAAYQEMRDLSERHNSPTLEATALYALANVTMTIDRPMSMRYLLDAYEITQRPDFADLPFGNDIDITILEGLSRSYFAEREWVRAFQYAKDTATALEARRGALAVEELQTSVMAQLSSAYELMIFATLLDRSNNDATKAATQAFAYAERAKSRALLDVLGASAGGRHARDDADLTNLRGDIEQIQNDLRQHDGLSPGQRDLAEAELQQLLARYDEIVLRQSLRMQDARFAGSSQPIRIEELQASLARLRRDDQSAVVVAFFVGASQLATWIVREDSISARVVDVTREQLAGMIGEFEASLVSGPSTAPVDDLIDVLLGDFAGEIKSKRVVVVPHDLLHRLPIGALRFDDAYLAEGTSLSYLPSASLIKHLADEEDRTVGSAAIFADPDGSLRYARLEASRVESAFAALDVDTFIGPQATVAQFRESQRRHAILHLAAHGRFNAREPLFSSIRLADGEVYLRDISQLTDFGASLVVLSACNSGDSRISSGDELTGLSGAFLKVGAKAVLVNLWSVVDDVSAKLMESVYADLIGRGLPVDIALRRAKERMIAEGHRPSSWGGFVLVGSPE